MKVSPRISYSFIEPIKRHRIFACFMLTLICVCIFCAVMSGIKFSNSTLIISFNNVALVKFLRGSSGLGGMIFTNIFSVAIFCAIIMLSCFKKYTISIGVFFYGYYVYVQSLILIAFILEYGIINTLAISFCMLIFMFLIVFLMLHLFLICLECQNSYQYFKTSTINCVPILIFIIAVLVIQALTFFVLKSYIIILVY